MAKPTKQEKYEALHNKSIPIKCWKCEHLKTREYPSSDFSARVDRVKECELKKCEVTEK